MIKDQITKAYVLTTSWQQLEPKDAQRIGLLVQNQSSNAGSIFVAEGEPSSDFASIELLPNGILYEDILPMHGQIWAKTDSTATLSLTIKY